MGVWTAETRLGMPVRPKVGGLVHRQVFATRSAKELKHVQNHSVCVFEVVWLEEVTSIPKVRSNLAARREQEML